MKDELQPTGNGSDSGIDTPRALVGWSHIAMPGGIDLRLECARSQIALDNHLIEQRDIVMTRNQALLLARYLLKVTGQTLPDAPPPSLWARIRAALLAHRRPARRLAS